jgi:hypothetical protein
MTKRKQMKMKNRQKRTKKNANVCKFHKDWNNRVGSVQMIRRDRDLLIIPDEVLNHSSTMIDEYDFIPHDCCLCGSPIQRIQNSHNPFPLTEVATAKSENGKKNPKRCCSVCVINKVRPARIKSLRDGTHKETWKKIHDGSIYAEVA